MIGARGDDELALHQASAPDLPPPTVRLAAALSPHLAARRQQVSIDAHELACAADRLAREFAVVVIELAGGLFTPFDDARDNAEWLAAVDAHCVIVAPDRLGVLHDTTVCVRAAATTRLRLAAIALNAPAVSDASTGTNGNELAARWPTRGIPIVEIPRLAPDALSQHASIAELLVALRPPPT